MSWNYRLCKSTIDGNTVYGIHECYNEHSITVNPITISVCEDQNEIDDESTKKEIRWMLEKMLQALDKPVIDADNLE